MHGENLHQRLSVAVNEKESEAWAQIATAQAALDEVAEARLVLEKHAPDERGMCKGCREEAHEAHH